MLHTTVWYMIKWTQDIAVVMNSKQYVHIWQRQIKVYGTIMGVRRYLNWFFTWRSASWGEIPQVSFIIWSLICYAAGQKAKVCTSSPTVLREWVQVLNSRVIPLYCSSSIGSLWHEILILVKASLSLMSLISCR